MSSPIQTWGEFRSAWGGVHNFLLAGECNPITYTTPPLERVVDEIRRDPEARITPGIPGSRLDLRDFSAMFLEKDIEQALQEPFGLAHFKIAKFDTPGGCLEGMIDGVLNVWKEALTSVGFAFDRCYPIVFVSGPRSATNYHMDFSHVLAWQAIGSKTFCGLEDPDRWADREQRLAYRAGKIDRPSGLTDDEALCFEMNPGSLLWNAFLTPHWVETGNEAAMSINISHGGLRLHGELCRNEDQLRAVRGSDQVEAPGY